MWRGFCRSDISVSAPFVWRCLSGSTITPFPHPAHRTGHADLPHPALGQDLTPLLSRATPSAVSEPALTTPWGFPCCVRFPCVHAAATTPAQRLGVLFSLSHPAVSAFPERVVGSACASSFSRLAQRSLSLRPAHSRCHQFVTLIPKASASSLPPWLLRLLPAGAVAGWDLHPLESAALSRRTPGADSRAPSA
jgi:hypothetical protein